MRPEVEVSVVVPARNAAMTVGQQVDAILGQGCSRRWELVLVDDASTDGTAVAADAAAGTSRRYRRVSAQRRLGASGARHLGVRRSSGNRLVFCDADDVVAPGWLEALCRAGDSFDLVGGLCDDTALNPEPVRREE